jgi:hypothetical protein
MSSRFLSRFSPVLRANLPILLTGSIQGVLLGVLSSATDFVVFLVGYSAMLHAMLLFFALLAPLILYCAQDAPLRRQWRVLAAAIVIVLLIGAYQGWVIFDDPRSSTGILILEAMILSLAIVLTVPAIAAGAANPAYPRRIESTQKTLETLVGAGFALALFWISAAICLTLLDIVGIIDFQWRGFWRFVLVCASCVVFAGGVLLARRELSRVSALFSFLARLGGWMFFLVGGVGILFVLAWATSFEALRKTHRAATILLCFVTLLIFLFNLRTRCGTEEMKGKGERVFHALCWLAATIMTLAAAFGLHERIDHYGLTLLRVWALFVNLAALVFVTGYAAQAIFGRGNLARVNLLVAGGIAVGILLMLGGVLDPVRISVNHQLRRIEAITTLDDESRKKLADALKGIWKNRDHRHGREALEALAAPVDAPPDSPAAQRARYARIILEEGNAWSLYRLMENEKCQKTLIVYPGKEVAPEELTKKLADRISCQKENREEQGILWKMRFAGEEMDSYVLLSPKRYSDTNSIWQEKDGSWEKVGELELLSCDRDRHEYIKTLIAAILAGKTGSDRTPAEAVTIHGMDFLRCG